MSFNFQVNNNSGLASALFGSNSGGGNPLGDYSLIRSGAYKKLLKAYYSADTSKDKKTDSTTKKDTNKNTITTATSKSDAAMQVVKTDAENLSDAASKLNTKSLYKGTTAEDGTVSYDRSKIKSAVQNFISAYNTYTESTGKSNSSSVLKQNLSVIKATSANAKLLKEVGITYDKKGQLTLDAEKFDKASVESIQSLFQGGGSYGDTIQDRASATYRLANSAVYNQKDGASYSSKGSYSLLGNTNEILDQLL